MPLFGKILAFLYAIFIIGGAIGGGNMFQSPYLICCVSSKKLGMVFFRASRFFKRFCIFVI